jgi:hypothetical protein
MTLIMDNYSKAQEVYQSELIRISFEVEAEFKKINSANKDKRPVKVIIDELLAKKKKKDKKYTQAKLILEKAQKEFDGLMGQF